MGRNVNHDIDKIERKLNRTDTTGTPIPGAPAGSTRHTVTTNEAMAAIERGKVERGQ